MANLKLYKISLFLLLMLINIANGQGLSNFLGHWTGLELLDSPNLTYDNRNISLVVSEGGDRGYVTARVFLVSRSANA